MSTRLKNERIVSYVTNKLKEGWSPEQIAGRIGLHPYASWERGINENINGLIRWYLPKGTDFNTESDKQIAKIESLLNNRPRKCPGFKTPLEVASSHGVALQS